MAPSSQDFNEVGALLEEDLDLDTDDADNIDGVQYVSFLCCLFCYWVCL